GFLRSVVCAVALPLQTAIARPNGRALATKAILSMMPLPKKRNRLEAEKSWDYSPTSSPSTASRSAPTVGSSWSTAGTIGCRCSTKTAPSSGNYLYSWGAPGPETGRLGCSHGMSTDQNGDYGSIYDHHMIGSAGVF